MSSATHDTHAPATPVAAPTPAPLAGLIAAALLLLAFFTLLYQVA